MPDAFAALSGAREDVMIADYIRYSIYEGGEPTFEQEMNATAQYAENLETIRTSLSGVTGTGSAITSEETKALVKLMVQPDIN